MVKIPTLFGEKIKHNQIKIWGKYCKRHHLHGFPEGHRHAHCTNMTSPYLKTGYYIRLNDF